jgi:hypothetical protein
MSLFELNVLNLCPAFERPWQFSDQRRAVETKAAWVVKRHGRRLLPDVHDLLCPMPYLLGP